MKEDKNNVNLGNFNLLLIWLRLLTLLYFRTLKIYSQSTNTVYIKNSVYI